MDVIHQRALLDTSVVIDFPTDVVAVHASSVAISTITLAELAHGLHTADPLINAAREQRISGSPAPSTRSLSAPTPPGCTARFARASALPAGIRDLAGSTLLIAAVAVATGLPLVTRNPSDFRDIHQAVTIIAIG
jgi:predicted nucleic acid-binding protein